MYKKLLKIVIFIILVLAVRFGYEWFNPLSLSELAARDNKGTPRVIDEGTTLISVSNEGNDIIYYKYTLKPVSGYPDIVNKLVNNKSFLKKVVIDSSCGSSRYINLLEKHSAKAVYQYYDVDGNYLTEVWFEPNDCIK